MTLHNIIRLAGVPHNTSRYCTSLDLHAMGHGDAVNKGCVAEPAEADMIQHIVWLDRMLRDACLCRMPLDVLTAGHDAIRSCVGWLAGGASSTLFMPLSWEYATPLSCVLRHWIEWNGWVTVSFWPLVGSYWRCRGCVHEDYMLHSLGEYTPALSVHCTIELAERTHDVVRRRFSRNRQHCHHVYAVAQLLLSTVLVCDWPVSTFHLSVATVNPEYFVYILFFVYFARSGLCSKISWVLKSKQVREIAAVSVCTKISCVWKIGGPQQKKTYCIRNNLDLHFVSFEQ